MFIDSIGIPDRSEELDYLLTGVVVDDELDDSKLPFGIFPKLALQRIDLSKITLFCGNSGAPKNLLLDIIAAKLGIDTGDEYQKTPCFSDYLDLCYVKYTNPSIKSFDKVYVSRRSTYEYFQKNAYCFDGREGLLEFFESRLKSGSLCILQEPELSMSYRELESLVLLIKDLVKYSGNQFIISTNSPVIMEMRDALIYDFDDSVVMAKTWYYSSNARSYSEFFEKINDEHKSKNFKK